MPMDTADPVPDSFPAHVPRPPSEELKVTRNPGLTRNTR